MALIACAECNAKISDEAERCPMCGARTAARRKADFAKALPGAIIALLFAGAFISVELDKTRAPRTPVQASDDLLQDAAFLAKNPHYPEAIERLIRGQGLECPKLGILWNRGLSPLGTKLEALCAIDRAGQKIGAALHYAVYPSQPSVSICEPYAAFGGTCE